MRCPGPPHRVTLALPLVLVLGLAGSACILGGHTRPPSRSGELDFKLDPFTYLEEGKVIGFAVGTEAARYRDKEKLMPLALAIANKGKHSLVITRESFTLVDENGKRYSPASVKSVLTDYSPGDMDRRFTGSFSVFLTHFQTYEQIASNFYPSHSGQPVVVDTGRGGRFGGPIGSTVTVIDRVELPPFFALYDWLYFPRPDEGIKGHRFELHLDCPGLDQGVFVKFLVD